MPLHVLLETWRRVTLNRMGELDFDPIDVDAGAYGDRRLISIGLVDDEHPFRDG